MNYILEGKGDFYKELLQSICEKQKEINLCLISSMPLETNYIILQCGHSFNYSPIFTEVSRQKKINYLETQKLEKKQIKCPYCRKIQNGLLPFHKKYGKIKKVNWPPKHSYSTQRCTARIRSGKRKNELCNQYCFGTKCYYHDKLSPHTKICNGILKSGKNKGKRCTYKAILGEFCKVHNK